ncbi:MAG: hypothetical protein QXS54_06190, partial [Candidatus Methanomethylicaceae archaeon]
EFVLDPAPAGDPRAGPTVVRPGDSHHLATVASTGDRGRQPTPLAKPQPQPSPGRVRQGMAAVLAAIGTPAKAPKPRGKSPGWPKGRPRQRRQRLPVVKKTKKKPDQPG